MAKGFGKPTTVPTRNASKFMLAFMKCYANNKGDIKKLEKFLSSNRSKLNEDLLNSLPLVFIQISKEELPEIRQGMALLFGEFALAILDLHVGDREINLELSIAASQVVLQTCTIQISPENWAAAQNNLGLAYIDRVRGNRIDNLELAIHAFEEAAKVRTLEKFPEGWADLQVNLGNAYCKRIQGDQAINLDKAIDCYQHALDVRNQENFPDEWAALQSNLGAAYFHRIKGDRSKNLEMAIQASKLASQFTSLQKFPEHWAGSQNNLGNAYLHRLIGNRIENLKEAIAAYDSTLQVYTKEAFPKYWARTHHNLANAYRERVDDKVLNLKKSIYYYGQAAKVFTRQAFPYKWSANQSHLAEALMKQAELMENPQDLDKAIILLQEALEVSVPGSPDYIDSQYRLGTALSRRFEHNKDPEDLKQALQAYKTALEAISPEHYDREKIWQALPTTQTVLGSRLVREGQWQEGMQLLLNSIRLLRDSDDSLAHANALYETGRAHEVLADWGNARLYYRDALRLFEHLNDLSGMAKSRHGLGSVLASQGYFQKGMAELEKARELYQQLNRPDRVAEVDALYQTTQRAEHNLSEVAV